jgi:trigger factor
LKIEQTYLEDHQLEIVVETEQDIFEKAKHLAAKELAKGKKIPGYRPGKAPYQLILNHFGEATIIDKALEHFLDEIYPQVIDEIEEEPYGPGQVKEIKSLDPPTFIFHIPLQPEVVIGDYKEIRLPYEKSEIMENEVDEIIERMLSQQATVEPVDHPAEEGNLVDTSLDGRPSEADPEDEESYLLKGQPLPVMIKGKDDDDSSEWPFPGFSRQLLGASEGDTLELTHEFSDKEDVDEEYRGRELLYTVEVNGIRERVLPELDDAFVKKVSDLESVDELQQQIREELFSQRALEDENTYITAILDAILEDAEIKFPPQMVEGEIEGEINELELQLQRQGMDLEMYLKIQDLDEGGLRDQIRPTAEKRLTRGLTIGKISEIEDLDIKPEDITNEFKTVLDTHFGEDEKERNEYMQSGESVALLNRISSQMITKKTLDFLMAVAQGEDFTVHLKQEEPEDEQDGVVSESEAEDLDSSEVSSEEVQDNEDQQD